MLASRIPKTPTEFTLVPFIGIHNIAKEIIESNEETKSKKILSSILDHSCAIVASAYFPWFVIAMTVELTLLTGEIVPIHEVAEYYSPLCSAID